MNHVHMSPGHFLVTFAAMTALYGTFHLLAMTSDTRAGKAWLALGL